MMLDGIFVSWHNWTGGGLGFLDSHHKSPPKQNSKTNQLDCPFNQLAWPRGMLIQFPKTTMSSHYLNFRDIVRWCMAMSLNLDPQKSPKSAFLLLVSSVTAPLIDPFSTDQQPHSSKHMKFTIVAPTQGKNPIKSRQQHSAVIAVVSSSKYFKKKKKRRLSTKRHLLLLQVVDKKGLLLRGRGPFWNDSLPKSRQWTPAAVATSPLRKVAKSYHANF